MGERTYTIGEIAKSLGLEGKNSSTVRLWTRIFADCLSPSTRPEKGQLRLYTEDDRQSLMLIRDLRRQHLPYEEVRSRLAVRSLAAGQEMAAVPSPVVAPGEVREGGVEPGELRALLSPVFEVPEALRRFLKESDYSVGIHLELGRLAAFVEALGAKLEHLRYDLEMLRTELKASTAPRGDAGAGGVGNGRQAARDSGRGSPAGGPGELTSASGSGGAVGARGATSPSWLTPAGETAGGAPAPDVVLNEYGLRPLPQWLAGQSLGPAALCRRCGSTTRLLGLTPTARVVLSCIECGERLTLPLGQLEKGLGLRRSFWRRLWHLLTRPLARGRRRGRNQPLDISLRSQSKVSGRAEP